MVLFNKLKETNLVVKYGFVLRMVAIPGTVFCVDVYMQQIVQFIYFQF